MDQTNTATPDELQQAINNITNPSNNTANDAVAAVTESVAAANDVPDLGTPPAPVVPDIAPAAPAAPVMPEVKAVYGDPDLDRVKSMALSDLRPIIESIDIEPEKKFKIYKEINRLGIPVQQN